MNPVLEDKLAHLPTRPGVYQHKDAEGTVLYVGKAKNLRSRVRSYFQKGQTHSGRIKLMVSKAADLEIIVTDTEAEALILENNLIKKLKPRYNVNLKDDKTYPYICIKNERFPRVFPTRRVINDGSEYFGPYTDVKNMKRVLRIVRGLFRLRTCSLHLSERAIDAGKYQVCLEYHIKKCSGPCEGLQTQEHYDGVIDQIRQLLNGKTRTLIELLSDEMKRLAGEQQFEEAAHLRDQVVALKSYAQKQKIVSKDFVDRDLFAITLDCEADVACGVLFKVRDGKVVGRQHKYVRRIADCTEGSLLQSLLERHYTDAAFIPDEIHLSHALEDASALEALLKEGKGKKVPFKVPERGDKAGLVRMVESNAELLLDEWKRAQDKREAKVPHAVEALQRDLRLKKPPRRMECFDISHLGGTGTVASCVVFVDGKPKKSEYRTYKIRTVEDGTPDDFQSMREVILRRYRRVNEENGPWPDLVVIDGGKGQLSSSVEALREAEVYGQFTVVGLAKRLEEVFFPGESASVIIPRTSSSLQLIQRIRNEAHRFAVTFQRKQRKMKTLNTELTEVPGIGTKTAQKLLRALGSVKQVRQAEESTLAEVVGKAAARKVYAHFHPVAIESADSQSTDAATSGPSKADA